MTTKAENRAATKSILDYFATMPEPRRNTKNKRHLLIDIIVIAILATICGAEHFTEMEEYGKANEDFLRTFLKLPNGIPSHDTFGAVFARLDPVEFSKCFAAWVEAIRTLISQEIIAFDGKVVRRSHNQPEKKGAIHLVSAWATKNRLTLGQVKVDQKSNEIKAIPELLQMLHLKGCIVTIDAIGTQKEIVELIREQEADYMLALKDNQPNLRAEVEGIFDAERAAQKKEEKTKPEESIKSTSVFETIENGHGRQETRRVLSLEAPDWLRNKEQWRDMISLVMVESARIEGEKDSTERRYYISSLTPDAEKAAGTIRAHWGIENQCHWVLDVQFNEDQSRVRVGNAPENLALVRKMTNNLLQQETTLKRGTKTKRLRAGWDRQYLLKILNVKLSNP